MKELFKKWLQKLACRHEWTIIAKMRKDIEREYKNDYSNEASGKTGVH